MLVIGIDRLGAGQSNRRQDAGQGRRRENQKNRLSGDDFKRDILCDF